MLEDLDRTHHHYSMFFSFYALSEIQLKKTESFSNLGTIRTDKKLLCESVIGTELKMQNATRIILLNNFVNLFV